MNTRRTFLESAALPLTALSASRVLGANDRINVGLIGVGNIGFRHLSAYLVPTFQAAGKIQVTGFSDIYTGRVARSRDFLKLEQKHVHHDYRDLLARRDVDAVFICTPEHWHFQMAMDSLEAGKDIYLEKPVTYTIEQARQLAAAVKKSSRVVQVGSQHLSDLRYHMAKEAIAKGWIGQPLWAQSTYSVNSVYGCWNMYLIEEGANGKTVDWKRFLGPAPARPFSGERYFRWRKYWDYCGGVASDFFYHRLAPLLFTLGPRFPHRVSGMGGIFLHKDREVPETYSTAIEYDSFLVNISASTGAAHGERGMPPAIYGHEGVIQFMAGAIEVTPESLYAKKFEAATGKKLVRLETAQWADRPIRQAHMENFFECMRTRKQPVFDIELGYQVMTAIRLGVDSYRQGRIMAFDPQSQRVLDAPPPRPGYEGDGSNSPEAKLV